MSVCIYEQLKLFPYMSLSQEQWRIYNTHLNQFHITASKQMGLCPSKMDTNWEEEDEYKKLVHKMRLVQREIAMVMSQREEENKAYERQVMEFTFKEAEWRRERKKLKEELKRLRKDKASDSEKDHHGECCEQMREERARRDEAIEKWKMLYLAIKEELDDLIRRTTLQGEGLYWRAEEDEYFMEEMQKELKSKDDTIDVLCAQVALLEEGEYKRKREVDILRQSLKIMCNKKKLASPKYGC